VGARDEGGDPGGVLTRDCESGYVDVLDGEEFDLREVAGARWQVGPCRIVKEWRWRPSASETG
jgi:hypothetical protein